VSDRRRFPRVDADVVYRPAGLSLVHHHRNTQDISLGGMRVFSDEEFRIGSRLDLDILLADGSAVRCWAQVVWILKLKPHAPAGYDVGLKFMDMTPQDLQRLAAVLRRPAV
jgi:c-di-GMP-binding flagellar brake protein YcgR